MLEWTENKTVGLIVASLVGLAVFSVKWVFGWFQRIIDSKDKTINDLQEQIESEREAFKVLNEANSDIIDRQQARISTLEERA